MRKLSTFGVVALMVAASSRAVAQSTDASTQFSRPSLLSDRLTLDAAYSRVWVQNTTEGTALPMRAMTGRLSWRLGEPALKEDAPLADKLAVGVFWTKAPAQHIVSGRVGFSHFGAFAEYLPVGVTGFGYFEPNVSLSVGSFRPDVAQRVEVIPTPLLNYGDTSPANLGIMPAAGTRIWFTPKLGLRLDVHDLIVHSKKTWFNNAGFSAGLSARL
jgi:hypothetical protein